MDRCLLGAAQQLGRSPADVAAAVRATPFHPALLALLRQAAAAPEALEMLIVSDANTFYIGELLGHHGLRGAFSEVHSNRAEWRDGALRVAAYHSAAHGCRLCPPNLCKGRVLAELLERRAAAGRRYARALYVGDGKGGRAGPGVRSGRCCALGGSQGSAAPMPAQLRPADWQWPLV